jgi:hypothetical protein
MEATNEVGTIKKEDVHMVVHLLFFATYFDTERLRKFTVDASYHV